MRHWFGATLAGMVFVALSATAAKHSETRRHADLYDPRGRAAEFRGHRENTFATIHAVAPFYSVLIRVNPENPASQPISSAMSAPAFRSREITAGPTPSRYATMSNSRTARP